MAVFYRCDRCREDIDPKTGITGQAGVQEYTHGSIAVTVTARKCLASGPRDMEPAVVHLCRLCVVEVIEGTAPVRAAKREEG